MPEISVIIPCLNEQDNIKICIEKCKASFEKLGVEGEVIISDNGSTDKTVEIAQQNGANVVHCKEKGYGNALRFGFKFAQGNYVIMGDGDNSYDFLQIPDLYKKIKEDDSDMVTGSRLRGEIEDGAMPFLNRYLGTPVLTFILNLLYKTCVSDSQCGMRIMKKSALDKINLKSEGMEFASELFVIFANNGFKITEIPIRYLKTTQKSKLCPLRDGIRHLVYLFSNLQSR